MEAICTRAVIIDRGRIVADGTPAQLLARSRHHNAVTLTLPAQGTDAIRAKLTALSGVAAVEQNERSDGAIELTCFPRSGALLIDNVIGLAAAQKWDV